MNRLNVQESEDKHVRNLALKVSKNKNKQDSNDESEGETLSLLSKKFSKFLKRNRNKDPTKKGMKTRKIVILILTIILVLIMENRGI